MVQRKIEEEVRRGDDRAMPMVGAAKGEAVSDLIVHVAALLLVAFMWYAGAFFTNQCIETMLHWFGSAIVMEGWKFFIVPVLFSAVEIFSWERRKRLRPAMLYFALLVGILDFATSVYGVAVVVAGKTIPLLSGYTIDKDPASSTAIGIGVVVAILLTFPPEQVAVSAVGAVKKAIGTLG